MPTGISKKTGRPSWQGRSHSEETKRKISEARKRKKAEQGFLNSPETRQKMSLAATGRVISEEDRQRRSEVAKARGFGMWMRGRKLSDETRAKIGRANKGRTIIRGALSEQHRKRIADALKGRKHSEETKQKIGAANSHALLGNAPWNKGKKTGIVPKTAFRKGEPRLTGTQFRRGLIPHNKGKPFLAIRGPNNPRWKGGITSENRRIRTSLEYKQWRMAVFQRDRFTCVMCGYRSSKPRDIRADHIKPFSLYPELRLDIANGRTLCIPCDKQHGWCPGAELKET